MNIVIIGSAKGLGLSLTEKLLEKGHKVTAGTLNITEELKDLQAQYVNTLRVLEVDVTDETQMADMAKQCADFIGEIDSLCNVAGVLLDQDRVKLLHECDISELRKTLDVNTVGPVIAAKTFIPYMKKGATLFTVTSEGVAIKSCGTWVPCYGISKAAATKISGILNASMPDVDFYSVHPGRMNTDMGRTTAQIEASESADGFCALIDGTTKLSRDNWYIDYNGNTMEA